VAAFKAKYGKDAVIGDVTQAGYLGPWLWKAAVERAKSFDVDKVVAASPGIELKNAPEGYVKLDAATRVLHAAPIAFDASTFEIWGPLLNGGCCVTHDEPVPSGAGLARSIPVGFGLA
jgi:hypothetical protein